MSRKPLKEEVEDLVQSNGGWLSVIPRFTTAFDHGIRNLGKPVDCPFPSRHKRSGGIGDFRFSEKLEHEGRAICTCLPDGAGPVDLLIEDGAIGTDFVTVMRNIRDSLTGVKTLAKREAPVVSRAPEVPDEDKVRWATEKLKRIAKHLLPLNHPDAKVGRWYFKRRGIPLNAMIGDVKFHPGLEYFNTVNEKGEKRKVLVGRFPAIVSAFRGKDGRLVNLHKIYLTDDGKKLDSVSKPKKIDTPLPGFKGSSMRVASVPGCRTLHLTEGVEKAWAIHLATGETSRAANSCSTLASVDVNPSEFDRVVIWSDNDPRNEKTGKDGVGQTYAYRLFMELLSKGFEVTFMLPIVDHSEAAKGPDWEDLIVSHGVLEMPTEQRVPFLRTLAEEGGIVQMWKCKAA